MRNLTDVGFFTLHMERPIDVRWDIYFTERITCEISLGFYYYFTGFWGSASPSIVNFLKAKKPIMYFWGEEDAASSWEDTARAQICCRLRLCFRIRLLLCFCCSVGVVFENIDLDALGYISKLRVWGGAFWEHAGI